MCHHPIKCDKFLILSSIFKQRFDFPYQNNTTDLTSSITLMRKNKRGKRQNHKCVKIQHKVTIGSIRDWENRIFTYMHMLTIAQKQTTRLNLVIYKLTTIKKKITKSQRFWNFYLGQAHVFCQVKHQFVTSSPIPLANVKKITYQIEPYN